MVGKLVLAAALLGVLPEAAACSLAVSGPYRMPEEKVALVAAVDVELASVRMQPWIDACDAGMIVITLAGASLPELERQGYRIVPASGVQGTDMFPDHLIAVQDDGNGTASLSWTWRTMTLDSGRRLRWRFQIVPVSPSGVEGRPVKVCVSTDDSCPAAPAR